MNYIFPVLVFKKISKIFVEVHASFLYFFKVSGSSLKLDESSRSLFEINPLHGYVVHVDISNSVLTVAEEVAVAQPQQPRVCQARSGWFTGQLCPDMHDRGI